jgi:hypothetical protein
MNNIRLLLLYYTSQSHHCLRIGKWWRVATFGVLKDPPCALKTTVNPIYSDTTVKLELQPTLMPKCCNRNFVPSINQRLAKSPDLGFFATDRRRVKLT